MGLRFRYLFANLTRNPLRSLLTCAAVALPIIVFVLSESVVEGVDSALDRAALQLRLAVVNKSSIINPLPIGHRAKIESLDPTHREIVSVCGLRWIGGKLDNDPRPLMTLGVDSDTFPQTFPEWELKPAELENWRRDRQALVIGRGVAEQFHWKIGDKVTINPSVPPYTPMQFNVVAIGNDQTDPMNNFFHLEYLIEECKLAHLPAEVASFFYVKTGSRAALDRYKREIDALFANSPDATATQDEKAFAMQFITQQFDLPTNLRILSLVTVFVAIMAAANTMSLNFRDRFAEYATLKALGFPGGFVLSLVQIESLVLCGLGALVGAAAPYLAFTQTPLKNVTVPLIQHLDILPATCGWALVIGVSIGLLAGLAPSLVALRLKVVNALRMLE